jgi:ABC-2 type transport system permease protein
VSAVISAVRVELLKARRSRLPWITFGAFTLVGAFGGLIMFILQDLSRARTLGLLGTKAALTGGTADWTAYFALLGQIVAVGGAVLFGLVVVWLFGREFSQDTAKDLMALPTARTTIVGAKFTVAAGWSLLLGCYLFLLGLLIGTLIGLPGWSATIALTGLTTLLITTVLTVLLVTPFALAASAGRGYLAGVAAMIAAVFLAQVIALLGYGDYFPWSVPALYACLAGPDRDPPGALGFTLVVLVGVAGVAATAAWWRHADHDR